MKPETWVGHPFDSLGGVKRSENVADTLHHPRRQFAPVIVLVEPFESFVSKSLNHSICECKLSNDSCQAGINSVVAVAGVSSPRICIMNQYYERRLSRTPGPSPFP